MAGSGSHISGSRIGGKEMWSTWTSMGTGGGQTGSSGTCSGGNGTSVRMCSKTCASFPSPILTSTISSSEVLVRSRSVGVEQNWLKVGTELLSPESSPSKHP